MMDLKDPSFTVFVSQENQNIDRRILYLRLYLGNLFSMAQEFLNGSTSPSFRTWNS